jgi:hypothetical protein
MRNIFLITFFLLGSCSGYQPKADSETGTAKKATAVETPRQAQDKRRIDSLKKVRDKEIKSGNFSAKREAMISDSIVKLQIEYDSLANSNQPK